MSQILSKMNRHTDYLLTLPRRLKDRLLPVTFHDQPAMRATLTRWLLLGLLLRLLFMPFGAYIDYLSEHFRVEMAAFAGPKYWYPTRTEPVTHWLDALTLRIIEPLTPDHTYYFWPPIERLAGHAHAETPDYDRFVTYPRVNRVLFLTKLPYLLCDLICAGILLHLYDDASKSTRAFKYWMLNPAILYAVYAFGRYETYAIALVMLSMLLLRRGHKMWGAVSLGASILCRMPLLMVLPMYPMAVAKRWSRRFALGILMLVPVVALLLLLERVLGIIPAFAHSNRDNLFFQLVLKPSDRFSPFLIGYTITALGMDLWSRKANTSALTRFSIAGLCVFCLMLAFSYHSPVYFAWIMPYLVWLIGEEPSFGKCLIWQTAAWAFFWLLVNTSSVFSLRLLAPVSIKITKLYDHSQLLDWLANIGLDSSLVTIVAHSVLTAASAWTAISGIRFATKRIQDQKSCELP